MRRGLPEGSRARELAQDLHVALDDVRSLGELCLACRVERELHWIDDNVGTGQLAELGQLRRGANAACSVPATPEDYDLPRSVRSRIAFDRLVAPVPRRQLPRAGQAEHARDVEGDVTVADDHRAFGLR